MRFNNIGIGILIAAVAAVVLAVGMFVGRRMDEENEKFKNQSNPSSAEDKNTADILSGDINDDGMINTADLALLAEYLNSRKKVSVKNADMNSDGKTDSKDFEMLKSMF